MRHSDIAEAELPVQHVGRIRSHVFRQGYGDSHSPDLELQALDKGPAVVAVVGQVPAAGAVTDGLTHEVLRKISVRFRSFNFSTP